MKKNTGIWIDHREALLVSTKGDSVVVEHVASAAESHFKPSGGWKAGGTSVAQSVSKEQTAEESRKHQYHTFYNKVMSMLGNSDAIALFGPGEAKIELAKEISRVASLQEKVKAIEVSDRMTEKQFIAKVKSYFTA